MFYILHILLDPPSESDKHQVRRIRDLSGVAIPCILNPECWCCIEASVKSVEGCHLCIAGGVKVPCIACSRRV